MRYGESNSPDRQHNLDEGGFTGCTRTMEKPIFEASPASSASPASAVDTNPNRLVLAKIVRDASGLIKTVDCGPLSGRLKAGVQYADVTTADLQPKSVTTEKIDDRAVTAEKIAPNTITSFQMDSGSVNTGAIQSGAVTEDKLERLVAGTKAKGAVATDNIQNGAVTSEKLSITSTANKTLAAVATQNIRDGAVTAIKLATGATTGAVDPDVIRTNAVTTVKINNGAVTSDKLEKLSTIDKTKGAVATANIQDGAVTSEKLEKLSTIGKTLGAVARDNIQDGAVTAAKIKDGDLPFTKLYYDYWEEEVSFTGLQHILTVRYLSPTDKKTWRPFLFNVFVETTNRVVTWTEALDWYASYSLYSHKIILKNESFNPSIPSTLATSLRVRRYTFNL